MNQVSDPSDSDATPLNLPTKTRSLRQTLPSLRIKNVKEVRRLVKEMEEESSLPIPKVLGQFELLESLGGGGMGFAAFSPDGERYVVSRNILDATVLDASGEMQYQIKTSAYHALSSWNSDGSLLATVTTSPSAGGWIDIWRGPKKVARLEGHKHEILGVSWSPDDSYLASWDSDLNVFVWDVQSPAEPMIQRKGYGFRSWQANSNVPRWSPNGQWLAVATESAILLVSPSEADDISVPMKTEDLGMIWWRSDSQAIIVKKRMYDLRGGLLGKLSDDNHNIPFLNWLHNDRLVAAWRHGVAVFDKYDQEPVVLSLPGIPNGHYPLISMLARGLNAQRVSADERYFIHHSPVVSTDPSSCGGGDIYLIDLEEKRHLWTGLAFNDGTQVRIEPTGRVQTVPEDFDKYLTYVIRFPGGRLIPERRRT